MEVCIVGGGISGIISAKKALDYGLTPVVLNKTSNPCGIWARPDSAIGVWDNLQTNTSKFLFTFSDYLWNPSDPDYPTCAQVYNYFSGYMDKHNLNQYFNYHCEVFSIERSGESYLVKWRNEGVIHEKVFKYVVIAIGRFSKQIIPFKGISAFKGTVLIGGEYRTPDIFTGKKVVCIGRNVTSSEIASEAISTAASVIQIFRKSYIITRKYYKDYPLDLYLSDVSWAHHQFNIISTIEENHRISKLFIQLFGNPGDITPEFHIDEDNLQGFQKTIVNNDTYLAALGNGKITLKKGDVDDFYENGVYLKSGEYIEADVFVVGTGYSADYTFLSEEIQKIIDYRVENTFMPTIMFRGMLHPDLKGLCFVGNLISATSGRYELCAEIGIRYILGRLDITEEQMIQGVQDEVFIRQNLKDMGVPYNYPALMQECLRLLGKSIDFDFIKNELDFANGPLLPQFLYADNPEVRELCFQVVRDIRQQHPFYKFS